MTKEEVLDKLKIFNDPYFQFDPIKHKYTYSEDHFISVTQFIQKFHKPFDTEFWSKKKAEERGISKQEILSEWKEKNDRANFIGTSTHNWIENYYNKIWTQLPNDSDVIDRINKFNNIYSLNLHKLEPICFENRIFSKKWKIAGMIDSIFLTSKGEIVILDWKSNGKFHTDDDKDGRWEKLLYPLDFLYKNHLNEYSIQISMYMMILKEVGINVKCGFLVHIGPDTEAKIYRSLNLVEQLEEYLEKTHLQS